MAQARITRTEATRVRPQLKGQCLERTFVVQRGLCVCVFFFPRSFSDVRSGARRQLWYLARPVLNEVRNYWSPPQAAAS